MADTSEELSRSLDAVQRQNQELQQRISELEARPVLADSPAPSSAVPGRNSPVLDALYARQEPERWAGKGENKFMPPEATWLRDKQGTIPPRPTFPPPTITREISDTVFGDVPIEPTVESVTSTVPAVNFFMSNASTSTGTPPVVTNKVLIADGRIKGTFPAGMGTGNYILTIPSPADSIIYAAITFHPQTLIITSAWLDVTTNSLWNVGDLKSRVVNDTSGFMFWMLGFTYVPAAGGFKVWNSRVGNIDFEFIYGSTNGTPALLPVNSDAGGWLNLAAVPP